MFGSLIKMFCSACKTLRITRMVAMIGLVVGVAAIAGSVYGISMVKPKTESTDGTMIVDTSYDPKKPETITDKHKKSIAKQELPLKVALGIGAGIAVLMGMCLMLCKK